METQILKLDAPFDYIYCNGSIGLHIATMIVYETKTNEDGEYELETHSHPVVKYYNRPGGTVWNRAELTDCTILCREDNKHITMKQFYDFVGDMRQEVQGPLALPAESTIAEYKLDQHGIKIDWPMVRDEEGNKAPQEEFNIMLEIERNTDDESFDYVCFDVGVQDVDSYHGAAPLYFHVRFNTKKELKELLICGMRVYYHMFKEHEFRINFFWPEDSEFEDVVNEVNQMEPEIRKDSNDIVE